MTEVLLFHHAQGLTPGVVAFADELRRGGHVVHTPDLFDGRTFDSIEEGMSFIENDAGFDTLVDRAMAIAGDLPAGIAYAGFSFGVVPAQKLTQTRAGALGALLCYSCVPTQFIGPWPDGVPAQIHGMDADPLFVEEGDLEAARELASQVEGVELFLYPGDQHYFADSSLPSFDADAAALLTQRAIAFLDAL
ncbi:MAG: dienelactone hydrolase family protein [Actinomycetota bacterium]|nr:dienelactone hydrolase family protein [Actinomycetota bacterium]